MAHMIPMLALGVPAVLSGISSILDIAGSAKKLSGGKIRRYRKMNKRRNYGGAVKRKYVRKSYKKGKGVAADIAGSIPILGSLLSPLIKAFGGQMKRKRTIKKRTRYIKGRGLAPLAISHPYSSNVGKGMLYPPGGQMSIYHKRGGSLVSGLLKSAILGNGLLSPAGGLLRPAGGLIHRRGHYRYVNGKRIHVKPAVVGKGIINRKPKAYHRKYPFGGYIPYRF